MALTTSVVAFADRVAKDLDRVDAALLKAGILDEKEQAEITRGLKLVEAEWQNGAVCAPP